MDTMLTLKKWEDQYFTFTKKVQEPVVRYTGKMADAVAPYAVQRPAMMAEMPTMHEVVDFSLKFRKHLVDEQATFVRHVMKAMDPVTKKVDAPQPAMKPTMEAVKNEVRKVTPRRTTKVA
jgi:cation diffusion facilitator CzcD-associated flavoprotein CzcO